jgi:intracellular sulfur oxidation DsrE/DsrF family protein
MMKLIVHAPTSDALVRARRNILNLLRANPQAQVELVINGKAVPQALSTPDADTDSYLVLCQNSLTAANLTAPDGVRTVDAAIEYIARRQMEGWAYFRA